MTEKKTPIEIYKLFTNFPTAYLPIYRILNTLNLCYFLRNNYGVILTDLLLPHGLVIEVTLVLVAVPVDGAV